MKRFTIRRGVLAGAFVALAALAVTSARAASPEDDYFAARDAAIDKIKSLEDAKDGETATKEHDRAFEDLQRQMRAIIGKVEIKGLAAEGKLNLSSQFSGDQGFGMLDGMVYAAADDKTHVIVTTETIYRRWLASHKDWWGDNTGNVPQDPREALTSEAFFTQAIQTDAAVMKFTPIPLRVPAGATFAFAMLAARSQDATPPMPDEIFVTLMQGGRVYVAYADVARKFAAIPACDAIRKAQEQKADVIFQRYEKTDPKDEKISDQYTAARNEADTLFLRCYAERASKQPAFAPAVAQAQSLAERLPVK